MPVDNKTQSTHWVGCWKVHPQCSIARLEAIEKFLTELAVNNSCFTNNDPLPTSQDSYGNFDDVFSDGIDAGETMMLQDFVKFVCDLGVMENPIKHFKSY